MQRRRVLFLNHCPPGPGVGSPVIIDRHLRRLADEGWEVTAACLEGSPENVVISRPEWTIIELPYRRRWWPPFRPGSGLLASIRARLLAREIRTRDPGRGRFDAVFVILAGEFPHFGSYLARYLGAELHVFVHDYFMPEDSRARRQTHDRDRRILLSARTAWHVSQPLLEWYGRLAPGHPGAVLPPIPEFATAADAPSPVFRSPPHFVYAGLLYDNVVPLLERIAARLALAGGRLTVAGRHGDAAAARLSRSPNIEVRGYFPTNQGAFAFVRDHATAFLVLYAFDEPRREWVQTCFPSKLVEFAHTGVPALVAGPADSAAMRWARDRSYPAAAADERVLDDSVDQLTRQPTWGECAAQMRRHALTEFNPALIHARLRAALPGGESIPSP